MNRSRNSDNSGSARAQRIRRISAAGGPIPVVRPNIGSMAWDAVLGKADCCNQCSIQWSDAALPLTWVKTESINPSTYYYFTAVFGEVGPQVTVVPQFGEIGNFTPCSNIPPFIEVNYQNNGGTLSVTYKVLKFSMISLSTKYVPTTFTQTILLNLTCEGDKRTVNKTFTFTIPEPYPQNPLPC